MSGGQLGWPWGHPEVISGRRVAAPSIWAIGPFRADRCSDTGGQVKPLWCGVRGGGQGGVASQTQTRSCGAGRGFRAGLQVSTPTLALGPTSQDVLSGSHVHSSPGTHRRLQGQPRGTAHTPRLPGPQLSRPMPSSAPRTCALNPARRPGRGLWVPLPAAPWRGPSVLRVSGTTRPGPRQAPCVSLASEWIQDEPWSRVGLLGRCPSPPTDLNKDTRSQPGPPPCPDKGRPYRNRGSWGWGAPSSPAV